jgi:hypothetical protein
MIQSSKKYITDINLCLTQQYSYSVWRVLNHDLEKVQTKEEKGDRWLIVNAPSFLRL